MMKIMKIISLCLLDDSTSPPNFQHDFGIQSFHPVLDGKILPYFPTRSILSGDFAKVPLIVQ